MKILLLCIVISAIFINFIGLAVSIGFIPFEDPIIITEAQKLKSAEQGRLNLLIINFILWLTALVVIGQIVLLQRKNRASLKQILNLKREICQSLTID